MSACRASLTGIAITTGSDLARRLAPAAALLAAACSATPPVTSLNPVERIDALKSLQAADLRVATVAFRLAASGADICPITAPLTGLTLHDAAQYAPALRETAREVMGLAEGTAILAVAPGSPADKAGLRAGDRLIAVNGRAVPATALGQAGNYAGVAAAYSLIEDGGKTNPMSVRVERGAQVLDLSLVPVRGCASRIQLIPSVKVHAKADGAVLSVTTGLLDYVGGDDELALVIAHEMAHNALGHRAELQARGARRDLFGSYGGKAGVVLATERSADRLAYFLMARAGYDLRVVEPFWTRLHQGPAAGSGAPTTHPDLALRLADYRKAADEISTARAAGLSPSP